MKYNKTLATPQEIADFFINCAIEHGMTCNIIEGKKPLKNPFMCISDLQNKN